MWTWRQGPDFGGRSGGGEDCMFETLRVATAILQSQGEPQMPSLEAYTGEGA